MRESKEYKESKYVMGNPNKFDDRDVKRANSYMNNYKDCYETHKQFLEWQKPEDVELVSGKQYLVKTKDDDFYVYRYLSSTDSFYGVDGHSFSSGSGYGDSSGYGDGNGNGSGSSVGKGYGDGDSSGYGNGSGNGNGYGNSDGYGNSAGNGDGSGY